MAKAVVRAVDWRDCEEPEILHAWNALAECAAEPNPFLESWYLLPSLKALDPDGKVKLLLFEIDGDLAGILPLSREKRYYTRPFPLLAGWTHPNAFLGVPLVARALETAFWRAALRWLDSNAGKGLFLHLTGMPQSGPVYDALGVVLTEQRRMSGLVHREERALLYSRQSPEDYFNTSLSGKKRKELRRQLARLMEQGKVAFERENGKADIAEWIEAFLLLEASGWKGKSGTALLSNPDTASLFREAMTAGAARGAIERLSLRLDGRPIAMLANFIRPPGAFSYKTAFAEDFARFSPGVLLQCENLLMLDRKGIAWCDSCASADHPMIDHIWRERRTIGRVSIAIGGMFRRAIFQQILRLELRRKPTGLDK